MKQIDTADLDCIYLSYDEPQKEEFWIKIRNMVPWAKRVDGVKGSDAAHKAAADASASVQAPRFRRLGSGASAGDRQADADPRGVSTGERGPVTVPPSAASPPRPPGILASKSASRSHSWTASSLAFCHPALYPLSRPCRSLQKHSSKYFCPILSER